MSEKIANRFSLDGIVDPQLAAQALKKAYVMLARTEDPKEFAAIARTIVQIANSGDKAPDIPKPDPETFAHVKKGKTKSSGKPDADAEMQGARIQRCLQLLQELRRKSEIKQILAEEYGIGARTIENIISRARALFAMNCSFSTREMAQMLTDKLLAIIRDPNSKRGEITKACRELGLIHGCQQKQEHHHTHEIVERDKLLEKQKKLAEKIAQLREVTPN